MGLIPQAAISLLLGGLAVLWNGDSGVAGDRYVTSLAEIRTRHVFVQEWDISCGAAVLATLLKYQHGEDVTEREVAIEMMGRAEYLQNPLSVRVREGFSLLDMKRVADARGYEGIGLGRLAFEDLLETAPIVVPIEINGYRHFVVFIGTLGDRVLLADPSYGKRTMRRARFEEAWMDFPELGHVGFRISRRDGLIPPNRLVPLPADFPTLN